MRYNLKVSIACLLVMLAVGPFVVYLVNPISEMRVDYRAELIACFLTLPILLLLSFNSRFALLCAQRPERVAETVTTARYVSCIVCVLLIISLLGEYVL